MTTGKMKGFTLSELMVSLALTSIMVSFAYMGYNYTQKLLLQFREQNDFFVQFNELNKRFTVFSTSTSFITREDDSKFRIKTDSLDYELEFPGNGIIIKRPGLTDTFKLETKTIRFEPEIINNFNTTEQLVKKIDFEVLFKKEVFHIVLNKNYDAYSKLLIETNTAK